MVRDHSSGQRLGLHAAPVVARDDPQGVRTHPGEVQCAGDADMRRLGGVGHERLPGDAALPHGSPEHSGSRDQHRDEVGRRRAAHHQAARPDRQPEHLGRPADHLPLDGDRRVIPAAAVRVQPAREHLGEHPDDGPPAMPWTHPKNRGCRLPTPCGAIAAW